MKAIRLWAGWGCLIVATIGIYLNYGAERAEPWAVGAAVLGWIAFAAS